jgi:hypothetical protein
MHRAIASSLKLRETIIVNHANENEESGTAPPPIKAMRACACSPERHSPKVTLAHERACTAPCTFGALLHQHATCDDDFNPPMQGMRLELWCLLLTAAVSLSGGGCLRWGYGPRREAPAANGDGGVFDSGAAYAGGSGGSGGTGAVSGAGAGGHAGTTSSGGGGGAPAAGSGGRAGASATAGAGADAGAAMDGGMTGGPTDAGVDSGAGAVDAAAADGGLITYDGCPSRPGVLFCDDFETADVNFTHWSYDTTTNGTVLRTQALRHGGEWSLLAATTQNTSSTFGAQARKATDVLNHQASGHIWMRSYNFVPSSVDVNKQFSLMIVSNTSQPYHGFEPRLLPGDIDLNTSGAGVVPSITMPTPFPRNQWVCVELHVFVDAVNGFYECYFDSVLAAKSGPVNTVPHDGYSVAEVGIHYAPPTQADAQVFVDDVYLGTSRIPCAD